MLSEIISLATGRVIARLADCALCGQHTPLRSLALFQGPGQEIPACRPCLDEFETWCEGRTAIESEEVAA